MPALAQEVADGARDAEAIDTSQVARALSTADIPDPDLLVRTSGEKRISNFLLWQCAYSELVFVDKLWPDMDFEDVQAVVDIYRRRDRRYGGLARSASVSR